MVREADAATIAPPPRERVSARPAPETIRIEALRLAATYRPGRSFGSMRALLIEAEEIEAWILRETGAEEQTADTAG